MCGIAGNISLGRRKLDNAEEIAQMLDVIRHRGPDDRGICGFSFSKGCADSVTAPQMLSHRPFDGIIGFNRLSILDLSQNGHQPMLSEDGKVIVAFNGEVYNAFDYVEELEAKGYHFHSRTDTEAVLNLYLAYGFEKMIRCLNGMFALVIADLRQKKFYMARDRFGIKPFYYSIHHGKITFASEIKCFLCDREFQPELDTETLAEHLVYSGTDSKNLMKGVFNLQPGEVLAYQEESGIQKYRFFEIDAYDRPAEKKASSLEYQMLMEKRLRRAVKRQMISDVRIGCQMSGGIDSTLITTYASQNRAAVLRDTISIVFDSRNRAYSEEGYMDLVQSRLHLDAHKYVIDQSYVAEHLEKTVWHLDGMANTSNAIGILLLSEKAKQHVTVLLSGEGADEAFAGYWQFSLAPVLARYWKMRKNPVGYLLTQPVRRFDSGALCRHMKDGYANFVVSTFGVTQPEYFCRMLDKDRQQCRRLYAAVQNERRKLFEGFSGTDFDRHVKYMMTVNLPDLLIRQDKMSMAASIENRVPFLDNSVIDFAFSLPQTELLKWKISPKRIRKLKLTEGKYILKELCAQMYGKNFSYRGKRGFDLPLADFLSGARFREYFYSVLVPGMRSHGVLNAAYAERLYRGAGSINAGEAAVLWKMVNLEIWMRLFLDRKHETWQQAFCQRR